MSATPGQLVVISGSSGSGKTSIIDRLKRHPRVAVSVSATTRPKRAGEVDGVHYHFLTREEFERRHAAGDFVETNDVFGAGHLYGSLKADLDAALATPERVYIMEVDVVGARNIAAVGYAGRHFFVMAPDRGVLEQRLRSRGTEDEASIERRLRVANDEQRIAQAEGAEIIINHDIAGAVQQILDALHLDSLPA